MSKLCFLLFLCLTSSDQSETLLEAWKARTLSYPAFEIAWEEDVSVAPFMMGPGAEKLLTKQKMIHFNGNRKLTADGSNYHLSVKDKSPGNNGKLADHESTIVFSNGEFTQLDTLNSVSVATLDSNSQKLFAQIDCIPVVAFFAPTKTLPNSNWTTTQAGLKYEGKILDVLRSGKFEVWVDPNSEFRPYRITKTSNPIKWDIELKYSEFDDQLIPSEWKVAVYRRGEIIKKFKGNVTSYSSSPLLTDQIFNIEFPEGTLVWDNRKGNKDLAFKVDQSGNLKRVDFQKSGSQNSYWLTYAFLLISTAVAVAFFATRIFSKRHL